MTSSANNLNFTPIENYDGNIKTLFSTLLHPTKKISQAQLLKVETNLKENDLRYLYPCLKDFRLDSLSADKKVTNIIHISIFFSQH